MLISNIQNIKTPVNKTQIKRCHKQTSDFQWNNAVSQPVEKETLLTFCSKGMKKLNKMLREERQKENRLKKERQERELQEKLTKEKINKPLPAKIAATLSFSNPFETSISAGQKKALSIGYNIRNDDKESLYLLNNKGEIVASSNGSKSNVAVCYKENEYNGCVSIHNHPVNATFSVSDINTMITMKLAETIVTTSDGVYTISRPEKTDFKEVYKQLVEVNKKNESFRKKVIEEFANKELTEPEADKKIFDNLHTLWQGFAEATGWRYEFKKWD